MKNCPAIPNAAKTVGFGSRRLSGERLFNALPGAAVVVWLFRNPDVRRQRCSAHATRSR